MAQPSLMSIVIFITAFLVLLVAKYVFEILWDVRKTNKKLDELKNEVHENQRAIDQSYKNIKVDILTLQADILKNIRPVISPKSVPSSLPANRKPRTEQQKALASKQRKEWWERRRQEKKPSPDVVTITQPLL